MDSYAIHMQILLFSSEVSSVGALQRGVSVHEGAESRGHGAVLRRHQSSD